MASAQLWGYNFFNCLFKNNLIKLHIKSVFTQKCYIVAGSLFEVWEHADLVTNDIMIQMMMCFKIKL